MTRRLRIAAVVALGATLAVVAIFVDAARTRAELASRPRSTEVARILGLPDLALSSSARWLRHPSYVEPWAAVAELPAMLDTEPAGGLLAPPTALFDGAETRTARRSR